MLLKLEYSYVYVPAIILVPLYVKLLTQIQGKRNGRTFRRVSQIIYFTHMYFIFLWKYDIIHFERIRDDGIECFIFTVIGVSILCVLDYIWRAKISRGKRFKTVLNKIQTTIKRNRKE